MPGIRIGTGFDVHRLAEGERLMLGGVHIPSTFGAVGHSDADVLIHAVMDALLGAIAMGDIGQHFPDNDDAYKGIDSTLLLAEVIGKVKDKGYHLVNLDATIMLQYPRIAPYIPEMRRNLARLMQVAEDDVSVKATTTEKLGFVGRGEGIAAQAVVLLRKSETALS